MNNLRDEPSLQQEFLEFVESTPVAPGPQVDEAVIARVEKDLCPATWKVLGKLSVIQVAAGGLTLTICPQFGLGFGSHNQVLHALHAATPPLVFYLLCGLFFVSFGALLSGFLLSRPEIRVFGNRTSAYFAVYSLLTYLLLTTLGPEAFVSSSLTWMLGAFLGNTGGFAAVVRARQGAAG